MADRLLAEFEDSEAMIATLRDLHGEGYRKVDAYTPYPMPEAEEAIALERSRIPIAALVAGLTGAGGAYLGMWFINTVLYQLNVASFPLHSPPAFIPITFELGVLSAGVTTFLAVFVVGKLPKLYDPLFEIEDFDRVHVDRFWVQVETSDPHFHPQDTRRLLETHAPLRVVQLEATE